MWTKEVTSSKQIITPTYKNIYATTPHRLNQDSDYKKCLLIAFGLSQPNKPLKEDTVKTIQEIYNKFGVDSFDLALDTREPLPIDALSNFGEITAYMNTLYINNPIFNYISKIKYYDKAYQQRLDKPLYRLELTIKTNGKLNDMFIPYEEIEQVIKAINR